MPARATFRAPWGLLIRMLSVAQMQAHERPDLLASCMNLGCALPVLSSLRGIRSTAGTASVTASRERSWGPFEGTPRWPSSATPLLSDDAPTEGAPEYEKARTVLRHYWLAVGFREGSR